VIRYSCPNCKATLESSEAEGGSKIACPTCGQRLQVPSAKTILADPLPVDAPIGESVGVPKSPQKRADEKFCHECGAAIRAKAVICPKCGVKQPSGGFDSVEEEELPESTNRIAAGVFAILLGSLGIHKFILGFTVPGIIMLLVTILTCGFGAIVTHIIGIIEGILYLSKSDREFYRIYVVQKKAWF
jgi:TM2 domain-containing membrane protein YozV/DNA-directed RNA polymerase subunit RPC12/RpoP